ncbi:MAG: hypothetical protein AB2A00_06040 [Myxococcota bacterium]
MEPMLRVPKLPVTVEITLEGGLRRRGAIHMLPMLADGRGAERVVDLLESPEPFLPLTDGAAVTLLNKHRMVTVRVESARHVGLQSETPLPGEETEQPVLLTLATLPARERQVHGSLRVPVLPTGRRLLDHVNQAPAFLPLRLTEGWLLVATRYVVECAPRDGHPTARAPRPTRAQGARARRRAR